MSLRLLPSGGRQAILTFHCFLEKTLYAKDSGRKMYDTGALRFGSARFVHLHRSFCLTGCRMTLAFQTLVCLRVGMVLLCVECWEPCGYPIRSNCSNLLW